MLNCAKRAANLVSGMTIACSVGCTLMGGASASRQFTLYETTSDSKDVTPFAVDSSQLPPDAIDHNSGKDGGGRTVILLKKDYPVRVVLMPATAP